MAAPAVAVSQFESVDLSKTAECTFITVHFKMGIGKMRQIRGLKVETQADSSKLRHQKQLIESPEPFSRAPAASIIARVHWLQCIR